MDYGGRKADERSLLTYNLRRKNIRVNERKVESPRNFEKTSTNGGSQKRKRGDDTRIGLTVLIVSSTRGLETRKCGRSGVKKKEAWARVMHP